MQLAGRSGRGITCIAAVAEVESALGDIATLVQRMVAQTPKKALLAPWAPATPQAPAMAWAAAIP